MAYSKHSKYSNHSCFVHRARGKVSKSHFVKLVFRGITYLSKTSFPGVFRQEEDNKEDFLQKHASKREISTHVHINGNFLKMRALIGKTFC